MHQFPRALIVSLAVSAALASLWSCARPEPHTERLPLNVVLISPDSLRADRLAPFNPDAPATPNFARLVQRGTLYSDAWATAPWTAPAMVSVMTGLYPPSHGVAYRDDTTPTNLPTLPSLLAERGYDIANFSFFSQISYFRNLGLGTAAKGLREDRVAGAFSDWLGSRSDDGPFFAWLHLLETHLPYGATGYRAPRAEVPGSTGLEASQTQGTVPLGSAEFAPGDREKLLELYDRDVQAMDRALGEVFAALEREALLDRTLIVFVADHGEELLDSDFEPPWVGHASTAVQARLLPETLRVPLVLAGPGVEENLIVDSLVQQVDILPTVLRLLEQNSGGEIELRTDGILLPGVDPEPTGWLGRLFSRTAQRTAAFFDSSPGGNLTPADQRGTRIQGVTDGRCLLSERLDESPDDARRPEIETETTSQRLSGDCAESTVERLQAQLRQWREQQTRRRLELLRGGVQMPALDDIERWTEGIELLSPTVDTLHWGDTAGQIQLAWRAESATASSESSRSEDAPAQDERPPQTFWLQYELLGAGTVGLGLLADVDGAFAVEQDRITFGPVPRGFWNDVASYSPIRLRVLDPSGEQRSAWYLFEVEPTD